MGVIYDGFSKGSVVVVEHCADRHRTAARLRVTSDHKGALITALCWSQDGRQVYAGDDRGIVTSIYVATSVVIDLTEPFSFNTRCYIFNLDIYGNI